MMSILYRLRNYSIFTVSGNVQNYAAMLRSVLDSEPGLTRDRIMVFADWDLSAFQRIAPELVDRFTYGRQTPEKPFAITRENNRGLRWAWQERNDDAVLVEDDVIVKSPALFQQLAQFAEAYGGRCLLQPGIVGFIYHNVTCQPNDHLQVHQEPKHFPIICTYFPRELELLIGYYDEGITSYGCDDNDYSLRCVKAAVLQLACPRLRVEHRYDSGSVFKQKRAQDQQRSINYFRKKWKGLQDTWP
jgi:hypothetical protein